MIKLLAKYKNLEIGNIVKLTEIKEEKLIEKGFAEKYTAIDQSFIDLSKEEEEEEVAAERKKIVLNFEDGTSETFEIFTKKELEIMGAERQKEIVKQMGEDPEDEQFSNTTKRLTFITNMYKNNLG